MSSSPLRPVYTRVKQGEGGAASESAIGLDNTERKAVGGFTWHTFPSSASSAPEKLEINGRKGRRVVCVVTKDKLHYRVFDIDSHAGDEAADDTDKI